MASLSSPNITTITSIDLWDPFAARNEIQHVLLPQVDLDVLIYNRVAILMVDKFLSINKRCPNVLKK